MKHHRDPSKPLSVPSEQDWGDYNSDLDQKHAYSVFGRRTNAEMQPFFQRNPIGLTDDLRWMPEIPFRYYMLGFRDAVMTNKFDFLEASDAASCFLGLVREMLDRRPQCIIPIMSDLLPALKYVAQNQSLYDADERIYGSFPEQLSRIEALYAARSSS